MLATGAIAGALVVLFVFVTLLEHQLLGRPTRKQKDDNYWPFGDDDGGIR